MRAGARRARDAALIGAPHRGTMRAPGGRQEGARGAMRAPAGRHWRPKNHSPWEISWKIFSKISARVDFQKMIFWEIFPKNIFPSHLVQAMVALSGPPPAIFVETCSVLSEMAGPHGGGDPPIYFKHLFRSSEFLFEIRALWRSKPLGSFCERASVE